MSPKTSDILRLNHLHGAFDFAEEIPFSIWIDIYIEIAGVLIFIPIAVI